MTTPDHLPNEDPAGEADDVALDRLLALLPRLDRGASQHQRAWAKLAKELGLAQHDQRPRGRLLKLVSWAGGVAACVALALVLMIDRGNQSLPSDGDDMSARIDTSETLDDAEQYEEDARVLADIYAKLSEGGELTKEEESTYQKAWQHRTGLDVLRRLLTAVQGAGDEVIGVFTSPSADLDLILSGQPMTFWYDVASRIKLDTAAFEGMRKPLWSRNGSGNWMVRSQGGKLRGSGKSNGVASSSQAKSKPMEIEPELKALFEEVGKLDRRHRRAFQMASMLVRSIPDEAQRDSAMQAVEAFLNRQALTDPERGLIQALSQLKQDDFSLWARVHLALRGSHAFQVRSGASADVEALKASIAQTASRILARELTSSVLPQDTEWPAEATVLEALVKGKVAERLQAIDAQRWAAIGNDQQLRVTNALALSHQILRFSKAEDRQQIEREFLEAAGDDQLTRDVFARALQRQNEAMERRQAERRERAAQEASSPEEQRPPKGESDRNGGRNGWGGPREERRRRQSPEK